MKVDEQLVEVAKSAASSVTAEQMAADLGPLAPADLWFAPVRTIWPVSRHEPKTCGRSREPC